MGFEAHAGLKMYIYVHFSIRGVGHTDLVFACKQGSLIIGLCMQEYKSLCAAITIFPPWLKHRHTHTKTAFISLYQ